MSEWQPIETAPKDGTDVLLYCDLSRRQGVGYWDGGGWLQTIIGHFTPSHWMPLPAPPSEAP